MELKRNPHGHVEILSCFPCVERCAFTENLRHSSLYVYTFFVQQCQKVITWRLRIILTVTCHSLSFILTTLGIQAWIYGFFPPFHFIFKGAGGWRRISENSVLNRLLFCSFFYLLTVSNAVCLSCSFSL